jgi:anti-sigma regulatory factor (Ser/Thr protein kinase)
MSGGIGAVGSRLLSATRPGSGRDGQPGAGTAFRWERVSAREYPPLPGSLPRARRHARQVLDRWGLGAIAPDAELALSELLTNAVRESAALPSRPGVGVRLLADPGQLLVEVLDRAPGRPVLMAPAWDEPGGRGLATVEALARRWDWTRHGDIKIVWCDFWL